uniref:WD_REPEATS_REGION domain-containing protein n=1 Tax=Steinernema glaseri TaxID=37863 RepID=A0A1I7YUE5_9BILA
MDFLNFIYYRDLYHFIPVCHAVLKALGFETMPRVEEKHETATFVSFNADASSIVLSRAERIAIYGIEQFNVRLAWSVRNALFRDLLLAEQVLNSDRVIVVSRQNPRKLDLFSLKKESVERTIFFDSPITAVKHNRMHLVIATEAFISVYTLNTFKLLTKLELTGSPCFDLSHTERSLIAYPSSVEGEVNIFDVNQMKRLKSLKLHETSVVKLAFNSNGSLLVSASKKGTVFRVTDVDSATLLYDFQRSFMKEALVHTLTFSPDSAFLCSSSETGTVHLFKLTNEKSVISSLTERWFSLTPFNRPTSVGSFKIEGDVDKTRIALKYITDELHVLLLFPDGRLQIFQYDEHSAEDKCRSILEQALK